MKHLIILLMLTLSSTLNSQNSISLSTAVDMAIKNNLSLKSEYQKTAYQKALIKSSMAIAPTMVSGQYGQINSLYHDNLVMVSQGFNFPTVYVKQKKLLTDEWKLAQLNTVLKESELKRTVYETYYALLILKQKEQLLRSSDSVYKQFIDRADLRLKQGESNMLEKATAENHRVEIQLQLKQLQQETTSYELFLQLLVNTTSPVKIEDQSFKYIAENVVLDTNMLNDHALIKALQQQKVVSESNADHENAKLLPDIYLSYSNMSMIGNGADNVLYNSSKRFQSVQVGLGIPLFMQAQRSKIQAAKINQAYSVTMFESEKKQLQNQYVSAYIHYIQLQETISYYESQGLKSAETIQKIANSQFANGEINYLDWVVLINQSISVKAKYFDAVKSYNDNLFLLNYLTSK